MFAIKRIGFNDYVSVSGTEYEFTRLPGNIRKFNSFSEALSYRSILQRNTDWAEFEMEIIKT